MKILTVEQMRAVEQESDSRGVTYTDLLQNAGKALAAVIGERFAQTSPQAVLGLVGSGNNGGDTLVALTELAKRGWQTTAYLVLPRPTQDAWLQLYRSAGGCVLFMGEDAQYTLLDELLAGFPILLDGILGTGFHASLADEIANLLVEVKRRLKRTIHVIAVDCPSGVDCTSAEAAPQTLPAELTICMAAVKTGLLGLPAFGLVGELEVVDISLPEDLPSWQASQMEMVAASWVRSRLPERALDAHKGTFGAVLMVGGGKTYSGAIKLAGKAAYLTGSGLVHLVTDENRNYQSDFLPEAIWDYFYWDDESIYEEMISPTGWNIRKASAMLLGPGWGLGKERNDFLRRLLIPPEEGHTFGFLGPVHIGNPSEKVMLPPLVVDADALKALTSIKNWWSYLPAETVLTPHPGEMSVLTGKSIEEIQTDRWNIAAQFSHEWGHVVVLKGALTVVAAPDGRLAVIPVATPALARAGTGDVLAGMITSLLGQKLNAYDAAAVGAWLHANAGLYAIQQVGSVASVLASDVIHAIPKVFQQIGY